ncbi:MAG: hypothetical protein JO246_12575 [Frankiaceae bacterium]|nr:hypothetical protein [Frankiaceae bacterium]
MAIGVTCLGAIAGCSSSSSGSGGAVPTPSISITDSPTPVSTPTSPIASASTPPAAAPLPAGYVAMTAGHLRIGVPMSWVRVPVGATAADVKRLVKKYPAAASRLTSDQSTTAPGTKMFAVDPKSKTNQVLALIFQTPGVPTDGPGLRSLYKSAIKSSLESNNISVLSTHLTTLGGHDDFQINADYKKKGITVHEVLDIVGGDGEIYDLTFTGDAAARTAIEETLAIT